MGRLAPRTPAIPPKTPPTANEERAELEATAARVREWVDRAKVLPPTVLKTNVAAEYEQIKQGERVVPLRFEVKEPARLAWWRARKLARRKAARALTEGEAFEFVTNDFLTQATQFPPDTAMRDVEINTIMRHDLLRYYEEGWRKWFGP